MPPGSLSTLAVMKPGPMIANRARSRYRITFQEENAGRACFVGGRFSGARRRVSTFLISYRRLSLFALLDMKAERIRPERTPVAIVRGVGDMLGIERHEKAFERASAVVTFPHVLRRVVEPPVSNDEIESAAAEIEGVHGGQAADRQRAGGGIAGSLPF